MCHIMSELTFSEVTPMKMFFLNGVSYLKCNHPGFYLKYNAYNLSMGKYVHFDANNIIKVVR